MGNPKSFSARLLYKDGELRETAKALLREIYLEDVGGEFGDDCWTLPGGKVNPEGYRYVIWNEQTTMGHRLSFELFVGPIPDGLYVLHSCDNPPCCNPRHLWAGSLCDNYREMYERGRFRSGNAMKTHCPQGHVYTEGNIYRYGNRRYCRACHQVYARESQQRRRAKTE